MVLQDAAFHTAQCQCPSGVEMSEPQAKVKQVNYAPLRWQQLTQFLLVWSLGVVKRWRNLNLKHHGHIACNASILYPSLFLHMCTLQAYSHSSKLGWAGLKLKLA